MKTTRLTASVSYMAPRLLSAAHTGDVVLDFDQGYIVSKSRGEMRVIPYDFSPFKGVWKITRAGVAFVLNGATETADSFHVDRGDGEYVLRTWKAALALSRVDVWPPRHLVALRMFERAETIALEDLAPEVYTWVLAGPLCDPHLAHPIELRRLDRFIAIRDGLGWYFTSSGASV